MLEWSWEFCTPNVLCATWGAFLMFSCIRQAKAPALISGISKLTFGMYLMHMLFLAPISQWMVAGDAAHPLLPVVWAIPCIALLTFVATIVTTKLLSFLPGSKWLIG